MQNEWVLKMISSLGFTKIAMTYNGMKLDKGIVLVADDNETALLLEDMLIDRFGAVRVEFGRGRKRYPLNYQCGVRTYDVHDKEEKILELLRETSFLPIVIVGGIVPEFLFGRAYLFRCSASEQESHAAAVAYIKYTKIIKSNAAFVQNQILKRLDMKSEQIEDRYARIQNCIEVTNDLWRYVNSVNKMDEIEIRAEYDSYAENMLEAIKNMGEFEECCGVCDSVRRCVMEFVTQRKCSISRIEQVEKYSSNCILYDEDFYYIPERLLKSMCERILHTVSFLQLKKEMYSDGMIECRKTEHGNFTEKKMISSIGERKRFIKIARTYLLDDTGMGLEKSLRITGKYINEEEMLKGGEENV